jgi:hypothetical protein
MSKELTPETYKIKMEHAGDLYWTGLGYRQMGKGFRDTGCDVIIFKRRNQPEQVIDKDYLKMAEGAIKGFHHEVSHTLYKNEFGAWIDEENPHDKEMADMILKNIDSFKDEDLFKL